MTARASTRLAVKLTKSTTTSVCDECGESFDNVDKFTKHIALHFVKKQPQSSTVARSKLTPFVHKTDASSNKIETWNFARGSIASEATTSSDQTGPFRFGCNLCGLVCSSHLALFNHRKAAHKHLFYNDERKPTPMPSKANGKIFVFNASEKTVSPMPSSSSDSSKYFACMRCPSNARGIYPSEQALVAHVKAQHQMSYKCRSSQCRAEFITRQEMLQHMRVEHRMVNDVSTVDKLQCTECRITFNTAELLRLHNEIKHQNRNLSAGVTKIVNNYIPIRQRHMIKSSEVSQYIVKEKNALAKFKAIKPKVEAESTTDALKPDLAEQLAALIKNSRLKATEPNDAPTLNAHCDDVKIEPLPIIATCAHDETHSLKRSSSTVLPPQLRMRACEDDSDEEAPPILEASVNSNAQPTTTIVGVKRPPTQRISLSALMLQQTASKRRRREISPERQRLLDEIAVDADYDEQNQSTIVVPIKVGESIDEILFGNS